MPSLGSAHPLAEVSLKNFPHQFSDLEKLTGALRVAQMVAENDDMDLRSNADFGEALAREGIYNLGRGDIENRLRLERLKPVSNQGTRTAAREMRRMLLLCGYLEEDEETLRISLRGRDLLEAGSPIAQRTLWRAAMLALALPDERGVISHPYRILLRLVSDNPGIEVRKLLLALEARDDSAAEYRRITRLAEMDFDALVAAVPTTRPNAANAVKILPSIAVQVGDIRKVGNLAYPLAFPVVAEDGAEPATAKAAARRATPAHRRAAARPVDAATIAVTPDYEDAGQTVVDLAASIALRQRRTAQHQALVRQMAATLAATGFTLYEYPFDCLARRRRVSLLIEAKTLDGSPSDERRQAEKALGQIRGYAHFDIPEDVNATGLRQIVLFSERPSEEMAAFLTGNEIEVVWPEDGVWKALGAGGIVGDFDPNAGP